MKKILFTILLFCVTYAQVKDEINYSPKISGYVRGIYNSDFENSTFQLKHARLSFKGFINEFTAYRFLLDVGRVGKLDVTQEDGTIKQVDAKFTDLILDAYIAAQLTKNISVKFGQYKIPFSTSNLKSPYNVEFVNRPLITKITPALGDVGVQFTYDFKKSLPLKFQAGVFNGEGPNTISNDNKYNMVARGVFSPIKNITFQANYYTGHIKGIQNTLFDFGLTAKYKNLTVATEYVTRTQEYTNFDDKPDAYFVNAIYRIKCDSEIIKNIRPSIRFDSYNPDQLMATDKQNRITAGLTFEFVGKRFSELKINFEKFNFDSKDDVEQIYLLYQIKF